MWLEKLGYEITNMSYENDHYHGRLENLLAAARKKDFNPPEGYRGAYPTLEPPWDPVEFHHVIPTEVIGVDGSQIYPDSAEPLPWAYAHAMVTSPSTRHLSRFFNPAELIHEKAASGRRLIDSARFSLELELASHVAWEHKDNAVVLLDGPILPPGRTSHNREGLGQELLDKALSAMEEAVEEGGIVAGFTPNGHARYLSNLLLATVGEENKARQLPLIDRKVIRALLSNGQRTALFKRIALDEREVYFFYTSQGRVELPFYPSEEVINQVWGCIKEDYPVALAAAHHLAVIPNRTASHLKSIVRENIQEGITEKGAVKLR
jgi:hypothetical protein